MGFTRWLARTGVYFGCGREYRRVPGEFIYVGLFAPDRKQSLILYRYVIGLLHAVPALENLIVREMRESVELSTGVIIETITASKAAPRGRAYALVAIDEAAFLPQDSSSDPDVELMRAVRPALARVPGSLLVIGGSPYARKGELFRMHERYLGKDDSDAVLVVNADTLTLNPTFSRREIARAFEEDPVAAVAEYGRDGRVQFRTDVESFISREVVEAAVIPGRHELSPVEGVSYSSFLDFSGGSGQDSATLALAHAVDVDGRRVAVLDAVREVRPPFSPERVCRDFADTLKLYRVSSTSADRFAADWPVEQMAKHGVTVKPAGKAKSDIYKELLPMLNSAGVELLDVPRLHAQLAGLERRVARGGRDSIDHGPGAHDDLINAAAGALVAAGGREPPEFGLLFVGAPSESEMAALDSELAELKKALNLS